MLAYPEHWRERRLLQLKIDLFIMERFNIERRADLWEKKEHFYVLARWTYFWLLRRFFTDSLSHVGRLTGRDRSTISHGLKNLKLLELDDEIEKEFSSFSLPAELGIACGQLTQK